MPAAVRPRFASRHTIAHNWPHAPRARPTGCVTTLNPVSPMRCPVPSPRVAALLLALAAPAAQAADLLPHEGQYVVRLGSSLSAPQIGTARQLLALDCRVWRLERDVKTDVPMAASLRMASTSELRGAEPRDGTTFDYELHRMQNDRTFTVSGRVTVGKDKARADLVFPSRPVVFDLPAGLILPVGAFAQVIDSLRDGATAFKFDMYDPELTSDSLHVDGALVTADILRPPLADGARMPDGAAWPVALTFTRGGPAGRQLFKVTLMIHEGGVLDRLTISTGLVTASAELVAFKPLPRPSCPTS